MFTVWRIGDVLPWSKRQKKDEKAEYLRQRQKNENKQAEKAKGVPWFHGTNDKGISCIVVEQEPSLAGMGEGSGGIVLEDDVFPTADALALLEDPGTVQSPTTINRNITYRRNS